MRTKLFILAATLLSGSAWAQQANVNLDFNPQKNTENLVPFSAPLNSPDVHDDRTVAFRLKAPEAQRVELAGVAILTALGQQKPLPFQKGADGVWSLTVGPLPPDMYIYHLVVDGVQMADPNNTVAGFTAMPPFSQLVVHGDAPAYYDARDVPHGAVTRHVYHSGVTTGERELYVYTPPGYDRTRTYPVLYLVGGSGDLPHNWIYEGRVNFIMDNLLAEGKALPMVIVLPNNQVVHRNHPRHVELTFAAFERELREHVIPLVEKQYSVRRDPAGRALSGLSMGGRHTMFVGFKSLDLFASFGVLSAGDVESETSLAAFLNDPDVNKKVRYLFVGQGTEEAKGRMGERCVALHEALLKHGVRHEYYVGGHGGHDWATWRHLVHERFLPGLWRGETQPSAAGTPPADARPAPPADSRPARSNVLGAEYPRVTDDSRVVFQLKAPQAQRVQADIMATKYDMVKDENGVWTVTTPPLVPGFHYYQLVVDGTSMNDPASHAYFGVGRDFSGIEVPEKGVDYYLPRDVPHGQVHTVWYRSSVTGDWRRCLVYTPPDYDASLSRRYPVLYLQHGSGEDETGWIEQGHAHFILDNLIAEKKAIPMIVVMDKGYAARAGQTPPSAAPPTVVNGTTRVGGRPGGMNAFGEVVIKDLVPFVDRTFRTIADRDHRAMAGLSMGGNQACQIALANLDTFAWLGMFSGTGIGLSTEPFDPKTAFNGAFADAASFNRRVHLVWIGLGTAEPNPFPGSIKAFKESLDKGGIQYVSFESPGTAHEWLTWRRSLNDFAPRLFK
jgi:enterochelin esterase-like enzyme